MALATFLACAATHAQNAAPRDATPASHVPAAIFVQSVGTNSTRGVGLGLTWSHSIGGAWSMNLQLDAARWRTNAAHGFARVTRVGVTPVFRYSFAPRHGAQWFAEGGVGADFITPLFQRGDAHFSTRFNFGTQIGAGLRFGARWHHDLSLRLEHFSNAGIRQPNPGVNVLQMRYQYWF